MEDGDDTILALGLGYARGSQHPNHSNQLGLSCKLEPWIPTPSPVEPSLTLGLPNTAYRSPSFKAEARKPFAEAGLARQSSSHSTASSFSKPGSDEPERASGRASDDEEEGSARKKLRLTKQQSALLEDRFKEHSTLNPKQKQALAKKLNLRPRQVEVWFQNRRARTKMKQTEMNCEFLRRYCDSLTEENQRLKNELHELRAIKLASPWYTQFQRAALTVCPSCDRVTGAGECSKGGPPNPKLLNPFTGSAAC